MIAIHMPSYKITTTYLDFLRKKNTQFGDHCEAKLLRFNPHRIIPYLLTSLCQYLHYTHCNFFVKPIHNSVCDTYAILKNHYYIFGSLAKEKHTSRRALQSQTFAIEPALHMCVSSTFANSILVRYSSQFVCNPKISITFAI
jgi:hypothetical protein